MSRMPSWQQTGTEYLYVATEAMAWFVALRVVATSVERGFMTDVGRRIEFELAAESLTNRAAARQALEAVQHAAEHATAGPPVWLVIATAIAGFAVSFAIRRARISAGAASAAVLITSVLVLNVVLHLALAGDIRIWDSSGLARFIDDPSPYFAGQMDLAAFVQNPDLNRPHGAAMTLIAFVLIAMWARFLVAGRTPVTFERVLRSFGIGFVVVVLAIVGARADGQAGSAALGVPYFAMGVLTLAFANTARAQTHIYAEPDAARRTRPWALAVGSTVVILLAVATVLGFLAYLDAARPFEAAMNILGRIIGFLLVIVLTPVFWVISWLAGLFLPEEFAGLFDNLLDNAQLDLEDQGVEESEAGLPGWIFDVVKGLAFGLIVWGLYRAGRALFGRREHSDEGDYAEVRSSGEDATSFGDLLRNLIPRRGGRPPDDWTRRHEVYRLFRRSVEDAAARGFRRQPGETPLEFGAGASRNLAAPVLADVAGAFDRARYGRHYPDDDAVRAMQTRLAEWEVASPVGVERGPMTVGYAEPGAAAPATAGYSSADGGAEASDGEDGTSSERRST